MRVANFLVFVLFLFFLVQVSGNDVLVFDKLESPVYNVVVVDDKDVISNEKFDLSVDSVSVGGAGVESRVVSKDLSGFFNVVFLFNSSLVRMSSPLRVLSPHLVNRSVVVNCVESPYHVEYGDENVSCVSFDGEVAWSGSEKMVVDGVVRFEVEELVLYDEVDSLPALYDISFDGKRYGWVYRDVWLDAGVPFDFSVDFGVPLLPFGVSQQKAFPDYDGKYGLAVFPSNYGLDFDVALKDGVLFYIDPLLNLSDGLQAYYALDDKSTTVTLDNHTNKIHANCSGVVNVTDGLVGGAYDFEFNDNTDRIQLNTTLVSSENMTISLWVNFETYRLAGQSDNNFLVWVHDGTNGAYSVYIAENKLSILTRTSSSSWSSTLEWTITYNLSANWHNIVFVSNNATNQRELWLDGVKKANLTWAKPGGYRYAGHVATAIGNSWDGSNWYDPTDGLIDEVSFWYRALNQTEIEYINSTGRDYANITGLGGEDTTPPSLTISFPSNTTYTKNITVINFTVSDAVGVDTCWYTVNEGTTNTTTESCANITGLTTGDGQFNWSVAANDSSGNVVQKNVSFGVLQSTACSPDGSSDWVLSESCVLSSVVNMKGNDVFVGSYTLILGVGSELANVSLVSVRGGLFGVNDGGVWRHG